MVARQHGIDCVEEKRRILSLGWREGKLDKLNFILTPGARLCYSYCVFYERAVI